MLPVDAAGDQKPPEPVEEMLCEVLVRGAALRRWRIARSGALLAGTLSLLMAAGISIVTRPASQSGLRVVQSAPLDSTAALAPPSSLARAKQQRHALPDARKGTVGSVPPRVGAETSTSETTTSANTVVNFEMTPDSLAAKYPTDYGGYFVSGQQQFTVLEVLPNERLESDARTGFAPYTVKFASAPYSWQTIETANAKVKASFAELRGQGLPIVAIGISTGIESNAFVIVVEISDDSATGLAHARSVLANDFGDQPPIEVRYSPPAYAT